MTLEEITLKLKPKFPIGQVIFQPHRNGPKEFRIMAYRTLVYEEPKGLTIGVTDYEIDGFTSFRRADREEILTSLKESDFYLDKEEAEKALEEIRR